MIDNASERMDASVAAQLRVHFLFISLRMGSKFDLSQRQIIGICAAKFVKVGAKLRHFHGKWWQR